MPSPAVRTVLVVAALAVGTAGGYAVIRGQGADGATAGSTKVASAPPAATEADRTATQPVSTEPPGEVATDTPAVPAAEDTGEAVPRTATDVVISFADWVPEAGGVELSGFVSGGDGAGTCVATLTRGEESATVAGAAVPNGATAACGGLTVPGDELSGGNWEAVLSYELGGTTSHSDAVTVTVP